jgi:hypothetical protein
MIARDARRRPPMRHEDDGVRAMRAARRSAMRVKTQNPPRGRKRARGDWFRVIGFLS